MLSVSVVTSRWSVDFTVYLTTRTDTGSTFFLPRIFPAQFARRVSRHADPHNCVGSAVLFKCGEFGVGPTRDPEQRMNAAGCVLEEQCVGKIAPVVGDYIVLAQAVQMRCRRGALVGVREQFEIGQKFRL